MSWSTDLPTKSGFYYVKSVGVEDDPFWVVRVKKLYGTLYAFPDPDGDWCSLTDYPFFFTYEPMYFKPVPDPGDE